MTDPIHLAFIYGSTRPGRFCDVVAAWAAEQVRASGKFSLDLIDPAENLPGLTAQQGEGAASPNLWQRMAAAEHSLWSRPSTTMAIPRRSSR